MDLYAIGEDGRAHKGGTGELEQKSKNRVQALTEQVLSYAPDLVGFQEDVNNWVNNMCLGDGYVCYRPNTIHTAHTMEYCSIYVRKGIRITDSGWRWLTSDGTNATVALTYEEVIKSGHMTAKELEQLGHTATENTVLKKNGIGSYSLAARLMNYVVLEVDGKAVIYVNTHLQHRGHNNANYHKATEVNKLLFRLRFLERCKQMAMLEATVSELMNRYDTRDVIMTADFNDNPEGIDYGTGLKNFYTVVTESGWRDCSAVAKKTVWSDTWNSAFANADIALQGQGYEAEDVNSGNGDRIDFCFVSDSLSDCVAEYGVGDYVFTTKNGITVYPSDHLPIIIDLLI